MNKTLKALLLATSLTTASAAMAANPQVGGADMFENRNIVENAVNSADHTTLVAAVTAAGLVETLQGPGPFTVFAPVNDAFAALPAGTVETLLMPENLEMLQKVLTAHVVSGTMTSAEMAARANAERDGLYKFTTVSGDTLTAEVRGNSLVIIDENGSAATVTISNVMQSNGVIHVIDSVLVPN